MSFLKEQIPLLKEFFQSDFRRLLLWCTVGLVAAAVMGSAVGTLHPEVVEEALRMFAEVVEEAGVVTDDGGISVFALLQNNWLAMLTAVGYGFLPFVHLPLLSLFSNGFLLGIMVAWYQSQGASMLLLLAGLVPHGTFELPALVISIACGVHLCGYMTRRFLGRDKTPMTDVCADLLRVVVLVLAPLVVTAAFVECYITPICMSFFQ